METIRLTSTASQGDAGCSCTYTNCSTTPCRSQHLFLHTNQTVSGPSSIREVLGSLGKAALSPRSAAISAGGPCSETSSPPFAVTPALPAPDLHHGPSPWNTSPSPITNTPGLAVVSQTSRPVHCGSAPCAPGRSPLGTAAPEQDGEQTSWAGEEPSGRAAAAQPGRPCGGGAANHRPGGGRSLSFSFSQGGRYFGVTPYQTALAGRPSSCQQPGWLQPCPTWSAR